MEKNCKYLVDRVLDMKLKTLIAGTIILVFILFAGIYYKTSPAQRKPYLKLHQPEHQVHKSFERPSVKDKLPLDDDVKKTAANGSKISNGGNPLSLSSPQRSADMQRLLGNMPPNASIFQVNKMPDDQSLWPSLGNGHIATVVNSDTIFMDGLYNGAQASSHRARIPALITMELTVKSPKVPVTNWFSLDVGEGIFNETIVGSFFRVEKLSYAHRTIKELFVVEIKINIYDHPAREPFVLGMSVTSEPNSEDLDLVRGTCDIASVDCSYVYGKVKQSEFEGTPLSQVHVYYSNVPANLTMSDGMMELHSPLYLMSVSPDPHIAKDRFYNGLWLNQRHPLRRSHMTAWAALWADGRVDMEGNIEMAQLTYSSQYYLLSSLPLETPEDRSSFGLSSGGLAHGALGQDYQGHVTGDEERWVFPAVLLLHSNISRAMLDYRAQALKAAVDRATSYHYKGALYPWETAFSGRDISSDKAADQSRHYGNGDIAVAVQQYMWLTNDTTFLTGGHGSEMVKAIAEFWESRITYDAINKYYSIYGVMSPGQPTFLVNNSMYTNSVAKASLMLPQQLFPGLGIQFSDKFKAYADGLYIPFDENLKFHLAYDKYQPGSPIKEPEVLLLNVALTDDVNLEVRKKNLKIYEKVASLSTSPLTLAALTINRMAVKEVTKAEQSLSRYGEFVKGPFKVWWESHDRARAVSFSPGMGSYLQVILFGYAGFRIQQQQLTFDLVLPPGVTRFTVNSLDYLGHSLTFTVDKKHVTVTQAPSKKNLASLVVVDLLTSKTQKLKSSEPVTLKSGTKGAIRALLPHSKDTPSQQQKHLYIV